MADLRRSLTEGLPGNPSLRPSIDELRSRIRKRHKRRVRRVGISLGILAAMAGGIGIATHDGRQSTRVRVIGPPPTASTPGPEGTATSTASGSGVGQVPSDFAPISFAAASSDTFWLLGTARCGDGSCTAIMRTTDGGRSFERIPSPPLPLRASSEVRLANSRDGYLFSESGVGYSPSDTGSPESGFYVTHDGGTSWHQVTIGGSVIAFATAGSEAYAVVATCTSGDCSRYRFERSLVTQDTWSDVPLPVTPSHPIAPLTAYGKHVWLSVSSGTRAVLLSSQNGGDSFATLDSPFTPDLGGKLVATSSTVLWAVVPTGLKSHAMRSTDGGASFKTLAARSLGNTYYAPEMLENSADVGAASDSTAVLSIGSAVYPGLYRTTDGGASFTKEPTLQPDQGTSLKWIGFTDRTHGAALEYTSASSPALSLDHFWLTSDAGATWARVTINSAVPSPAAVAGPRCTTTQLSASLGPPDAGAGHVAVQLILKNTSARTCTLYGYVGLRLLDANRRPMATRLFRGPGMSVTDPGPTLIVLLPDQLASAWITFNEIPVDGDPSPCPVSAYLQITPPDQPDVLVIEGRLNPCGRASVAVTALAPGTAVR